MLLPRLNLACLGYIALAIASVVRNKRSGIQREDDSLHPSVKFIFARGVPITVAATMTYLFLIVGGSTTVQLNVGSFSGMNVWSTWVGIWPLFLVLTASSLLGVLIWTIACALVKEYRPMVSISLASLLLAILAFFCVLTYFPSA